MEPSSWTDWLPRVLVSGVTLALFGGALRALRARARDPQSPRWMLGSMLGWLIGLLGGQALLLVVILLVPFGFDHPSSWGLHFGHLLLVIGLYALILLAGIVAGAVHKQWMLVGLQVAAPCAIFLLAVLGILRM